MTTRRLPVIVSTIALAAAVGLAQQAPPAGPGQAPAPAQVPVLPPRGAVSVPAATVTEILADLKVPAGLQATVFAAPPIVNYPACVTATLEGVVFVCVDRNGSLQTDPGMGTILRLVDKNDDGQADEYTVFASLDSPRGAAFDGETLYVSHPPFVTALRDSDNDGIADDRKTIVRGLGFGLDFRGADHTTNGIEFGIDGWLYVAVGDYGAVKAVGSDGQEIQMRGGGNVRFRPDGTELEIYSRGTRNDYDVAIDPAMNLFARGNTNDGGGFDIRLYHFVEGARYGYPSLFRNFAGEVIPPIADYGTGSGTGMLYVHEPGLPAPFGDALYSVDWGRNAIYRHPLKPKGATFDVGQESFVTTTRPTDMAVDGRSRLYVASWRGGQFRYQGEQIGYLARVAAPGTPPPAPNVATATDAQLVDLVTSASHTQRRFAQQALLRKGRSADRIKLLESKIASASVPLASRIAAIYTLKQLAGVDSHAAIAKAAADPALRPQALRALTDRRSELINVPKALFLQGLSDPDPRVQLQAVTGLKRLGAVDAAKAMLPLTASTDVVVSNVTIDALATLSAVDASLTALASAPAPVANGALRVLQMSHGAPAVTGLIASLAEARTPELRNGILQALARLHYRDGIWRGQLAEWWGTRPDTTGPYYDPAAWEESARIRGVLRAALLRGQSVMTGPFDVMKFATDLERNRVLPLGGAELLQAVAAASDPALPGVVDALLGRVRLDVDAARGPVLDRLARSRPAYRAAVVKMIAAGGPPTPQAVEILKAAAIDTSVEPAVRAAALRPLGTAASASPEALTQAIDAFASVRVGPGLDENLETAWRQFVAMPAHATNVATFRTLAEKGSRDQQVVAYAVLVQLATEPVAGPGRGARGGGGGGAGAPGGGRGRGGQNAAAIEAARTASRAAIEAAWSGPTVASLLRAIGATEAAGYRDRIQGFTASATPEIRDAAGYAASRAKADTPPATAPPAGAAAGAGAALVSSVPYEQLADRLASLTGDVATGRMLFTRQVCATCHSTAAGEPEKGPFLGGITTRYSRAELLESILRPSAKVAQGFATNWFETTDNRKLEGFVIRESPTEVVMRDVAGVETTLRKTIIANRGVREGSMMPQGLVDGLTLNELASLLAFLGTTK